MPILLDKPIGKFRKVLRDEPVLKQESVVLKSYLEFLELSYNENSLSHAEIISLFVILYQYSRIKAKPFQKNPIRNFPLIAANKDFPVEFNFMRSLKLESEGIIGFLTTYSFRFLPTSIREVLLGMFNETKVLLITYIPSSKEMLSMQTKGKRYITIDFKKAIDGILVDDKRDAFEFVLHDLEHAYCFFKKENEYENQIAFYKSIQNNYHLLEPLIEDNEQFKEDLEYCISDMNSHPEHLSNYFKAILIKYFLFKNQKPANAILTQTELIPVNKILNCIKLKV